MANSPIPSSELEQLTKETCDSVFANIHTYDHSSAEKWNSAIISTLLSRLVAQTAPSASKPSPFKFVVTSTIIQHTSSARAATSTGTSYPRSPELPPAPPPPSLSPTLPLLPPVQTWKLTPAAARPTTANSDAVSDISALSAKGAGKRGMHAASGAYWNKEKDGMWSFKYDGESSAAGGNGREFDVVVGVVWVGV